MSNFLEQLRKKNQQAAATTPAAAPVPASEQPKAAPAWKLPSVVTQPVVETVAPEPQVPAVAESEVTGPVGFKAKLDAYDAMVGHLTKIDPVLHGVVKASVKSIMVDLIQSPEMRELIIDRDIHNIMLFVQSSTATADSHFESVAKKRVTKQANSAQKTQFGAGLDALLGGGLGTSLDKLTGSDVSNIPTKLSR